MEGVKMAVFWVVVSCSLVEFTDVSEMLVVSIIGAMSFLMEGLRISECI
jgi:hypothetical protein